LQAHLPRASASESNGHIDQTTPSRGRLGY
jgi:hypothetical protein